MPTTAKGFRANRRSTLGRLPRDNCVSIAFGFEETLATSTAMVPSLELDPRVHEHVAQVREEVSQHHHDRDHQSNPHDDRVVALNRRVHRELPDPGPGED